MTRKQTKEHTAKINTPERARKISISLLNLYKSGKRIAPFKGKNLSRKHKANISKGLGLGKDTPNWKGDFAGYGAIHEWIRSKNGKAIKCESMTCSKISKNYQWAKKKNRKYTRNIEDYMQLCRSCHAKYDFVHKDRKCSIKTCEKPHKANSYCSMHAERFRKWGNPNLVKLNYRELIIID